MPPSKQNTSAFVEHTINSELCTHHSKLKLKTSLTRYKILDTGFHRVIIETLFNDLVLVVILAI